MSIISSINTNTPTTFQAWNEETLEVKITTIEHQLRDDHQYIAMKILVTPENMNRIYQKQWFHINNQTILNHIDFNSENEIELQLVLMPSIANEIIRSEADAEAVFMSVLPPEALGEVERTLPVLSQIELWYAAEVMQTISLPPELAEDGQVRHGFRTIWRQQLLYAVTTPSFQVQPAQNQSFTEQTHAKLIHQVEEILTSKQLKFETHDEQLIRMTLQSKGTESWKQFIRVEEEAKLVILYAIFPALVEEQNREALALQFMNENYYLMNGAFELDVEDGELRFRSSLLCPTHVDPQCFNQILNDHIQVMDHYLSEK